MAKYAPKAPRKAGKTLKKGLSGNIMLLNDSAVVQKN